MRNLIECFDLIPPPVRERAGLPVVTGQLDGSIKVYGHPRFEDLIKVRMKLERQKSDGRAVSFQRIKDAPPPVLYGQGIQINWTVRPGEA